ncbi:MAG: hypothetical protein IJJ22_06220 [Oscillospiraceae bacterium]|nr:hypothetical protein [Oscillospiraceae bacterium]
MDQNVTELQKRRADNIIWTCAGDYSFAPDFKAYDSSGDADIYWNIIFGAARRHYEYEKLEKLFAMLDKYRNSALYETLFWNALEPLLFERELEERPVLGRIRPESLEGELKLDASMSTDEIVEASKRYFDERFGLYGDGKIRFRYRMPHMRRMAVDSFLQRGVNGVYRRLADMPERLFSHEKGLYQDITVFTGGDNSIGTKLTVSELREFIETKFGKSLYSPEQVARLEKQLCTGNHKFTHLFYTRGEVCELSGVYSTFEMHQRKRQEEVVAGNRSYYSSNILMNRLLISRLSTGIMNSVLLHMQPAKVKASSGKVDPKLAWRAAVLGDEKVFSKTENENAGDMSVDILLDASHSQIRRTDKISSQAFIIAEALARCRVPCRVMSFCSMSGFTILRTFTDYSSHSDNSSIFDYYAEGCNRDGLAIRAAGELISRSSFEHRMLIILSDVKPLDIARIKKSEKDIGQTYDGQRALTDTAFEVRRLRAEGISVICIFTGEDAELPNAKMVYGKDFVRIRDFSQFADTVGRLIIDQMKNYSM